MKARVKVKAELFEKKDRPSILITHHAIFDACVQLKITSVLTIHQCPIGHNGFNFWEACWQHLYSIYCQTPWTGQTCRECRHCLGYVHWVKKFERINQKEERPMSETIGNKWNHQSRKCFCKIPPLRKLFSLLTEKVKDFQLPANKEVNINSREYVFSSSGSSDMQRSIRPRGSRHNNYCACSARSQ